MKLLYNISFLFLIIYFITSCSQSIDKDNIIPVFLDFGIVYAFNDNFRVAIHFQRPFIGFYWKF